MRNILFGVVAALSLGLGACGGGGDDIDFSNPAKACSSVVDIECDKIIECYSDAQLMQAGITDHASCVTKVGAQAMCSSQTSFCDEGETFHKDKAQACIDEQQALSCADFSSSDSSSKTPSCDETCTQ